MLKVLGRIFVTIGKGVAAVFRNAEQRGLTDDIVAQAEGFVTEAQEIFDNNAARRAWVLVALQTAFPQAPESILNLALELGVQVLKAGRSK